MFAVLTLQKRSRGRSAWPGKLAPDLFHAFRGLAQLACHRKVKSLDFDLNVLVIEGEKRRGVRRIEPRRSGSLP